MSSTSSSSSVSQTGKTSKKFKKKNNQSSVTSSSALPPETSQPQVVQGQSPNNNNNNDEQEALNDTIRSPEPSDAFYDSEAFKTMIDSNNELHSQFMKNMAFQQELLNELKMNANHSNSTT